MKIHWYNVARAGQESVYGGGTQIENIFMLLIFIINDKFYFFFFFVNGGHLQLIGVVL